MPPPRIRIARSGQFDTRGSPPDTTGAVGPWSFIETVNRNVGIYARGGHLLAKARLGRLFGSSTSHISGPEIHWDPYTGAFYYAGIDVTEGAERIFFGWSRTQNPRTLEESAWCKYRYEDYGTAHQIPDFPKLGDTQGFALVGVNVFNEQGLYRRSDVVSFAKPAPGTTADCPSSVAATQFRNLSAEGAWDPGSQTGGVPAASPVPVVQTDAGATGYVVAPDLNGVGGFGHQPGMGDALAMFPVTDATDEPSIGDPVIVPIVSWNKPLPAHQMGARVVLDTLDGRLTQAVSGVDPAHGGTLGIWTQHTVYGGGGAQVRWYEIHPAGSMIQNGTISEPARYVFNAAIAPDRQVGPSGSSHGDAMVIGFDTSGRTQYVAIRMISKSGSEPMTRSVLVRRSPGIDNDFTCHYPLGPRCSWGYYGGASPDPVPSEDLHGRVWLANEWTNASRSGSGVDWRTEIWEAQP